MMKCILSFLFVSALALIIATSAFANCPDPTQISYKHKILDKAWFARWSSSDGQWSTVYTNMTYPSAPTTPEVSFESVAILTDRGKYMSDSDTATPTPHVRCIYRVKDYGLIILRNNNFTYRRTLVNNRYGAWKYIPLESDPNLGEWRCSKRKSVADCSFFG